MRSHLGPNQSELKDARGKAERGALRRSQIRPNRRPRSSRKSSPLDATSPLTEQVHTALDRVSEGRDYLIRTIVFEASGETEIGKAAVAHVILNRKRNGRWGERIQDVVTHPWQFEPWMTRKDEIEKLSPNDPRYLDAAKIADVVLAGLIQDPTSGATHFLNPVVVRQRRGGSLPSWADGDGQPIGRHVFYSPDRDRPLPQQAEAQRLQPTTLQRQSPRESSACGKCLPQPLTRVDCDKPGSPPVLWAGFPCFTAAQFAEQSPVEKRFGFAGGVPAPSLGSGPSGAPFSA